MNKRDRERFKKLLTERREQIQRTMASSREAGLGIESDDLPDEVDQASTETGQTMQLRLRDRENYLLKKIAVALEKIESGEYGICTDCEEPINIKRLEARPVTELCIRCKEDQERAERSFAE